MLAACEYALGICNPNFPGLRVEVAEVGGCVESVQVFAGQRVFT